MRSVKILTKTAVEQFLVSVVTVSAFKSRLLQVRWSAPVPCQRLRWPRQARFIVILSWLDSPSPARYPHLQGSALCRRCLPYCCAALAMSAVVPYRVDCLFMHYYVANRTSRHRNLHHDFKTISWRAINACEMDKLLISKQWI